MQHALLISNLIIKLYIYVCVCVCVCVCVYVTGKLRNQAFRDMSKNFSHFLK